MRLKKILPPVLGIVVFFLVWHFVCAAGIFSSYVLPSPEKCFLVALKMIRKGELAEDIMISMMRVLKGFSIAFVAAFLLGMFQFLVPAAADYYDYLIQFFRNVPPLAMIPLLILWFGIGETTKIVIIILASFFPMYLNIVKGFHGCDPKLIEVGNAFGYSKIRIFSRIILPGALADILVGMRIGLGYSWRAIIGAEMVAASAGLGHLILFSQQMSRTDKVIVGIFAIGLVGYLTDYLFGYMIKRFVKETIENGWN